VCFRARARHIVRQNRNSYGWCVLQSRWGHSKRERRHKSPGRQDSTDYAADLSSDHSTPSTQSPRHRLHARTGESPISTSHNREKNCIGRKSAQIATNAISMSSDKGHRMHNKQINIYLFERERSRAVIYDGQFQIEMFPIVLQLRRHPLQSVEVGLR
jgi:hypothetical protein